MLAQAPQGFCPGLYVCADGTLNAPKKIALTLSKDKSATFKCVTTLMLSCCLLEFIISLYCSFCFMVEDGWNNIYTVTLSSWGVNVIQCIWWMTTCYSWSYIDAGNCQTFQSEVLTEVNIYIYIYIYIYI